MKVLANNVRYIINSINNNKKIILLNYTPLLYSVVCIMEKEFKLIKFSFIFLKWIMVEVVERREKTRLNIRIFCLDNKKYSLSYKELKNFFCPHTYVIAFSFKGMYSINKLMERKKGGRLFCLIY